MKVQLNGTEFEFKFYHKLPRYPQPRKMDHREYCEYEVPSPGGTSCVLFENGEEVHRVDLTVYYKDQFNKVVGRKESLTRVLNTFDFSKEDRKAIWAEYLKTHKV